MKTWNRRFFKIKISIFLLVALLLWGCQSEERQQQSLTAPGAAWSLGNYWASFGENTELQVYIGPQAQDVFAVNVPAPSGPDGQGYELVYDVLKARDSEPSSFFLDFEATDAATICIGLLEGDVLQQADLYQADFTGKTPLLTDGPLRMFGFPGGWNGWRGAEPPARVAPLSVSSDAIPLYANAAPLAPLMKENPCKVTPPAPAPQLPFLEVVVTVAGGNGTSDIYEFDLQEPGAAKMGVMYDDGVTPLYFEDKTTGHADSVLADQSWASGADPFRMYVPKGQTIDGDYQAVVSNNWADILGPGSCPANPLVVTITVKTHTAEQTLTCNVPCDSPADAKIGATFPAGTIQPFPCPE